MLSDVWLTPPHIFTALGAFDLDPCAAVGQPWKTAGKMLTVKDDGLAHEWEGRVWLNPPYGRSTAVWLERLAQHGTGTALIFARTETRMFFDHVWPHASALCFLRGRIQFHRLDLSTSRVGGGAGSGAPSVLIAYGSQDAAALLHSGLPGAYVNLWKSKVLGAA